MPKKNSATFDFRNMTRGKKQPWYSSIFSSSQNTNSKRFNSRRVSKSSQKEKGAAKTNYIARITMILRLVLLPLLLIVFLVRFVFKGISLNLPKIQLVKIVFGLVFLAILFNFAQLQVISDDTEWGFTAQDLSTSPSQLILARRGQVYIQDSSQTISSGRRYIPLTATQNVANLFFNPSQLKGLLRQGVDLHDVVNWISGSLNLPYNEVYDLLKKETDREKPRKYVLIKQFISENQKSVVEYLRTNEESKDYMRRTGLNIQEKEIRSYPQGPLLAQTIGYVPKYQVGKEEALKIGGCRDMVYENEQRGTAGIEYTIGYYGLEQKYCSLLGGLNGRKKYNNEINSDSSDDLKVEDGANIYTTIDKNLQLKTESILDKALRDNASGDRMPRNATAIAMEAKTGKILSMASAPTFDPESYYDFSSNPEVYRNQASGGDYEVGSVMKPLTIAAALNDYQLGRIGSQGQIIGVPPNFAFTDYDAKGKVYQALNGDKLYIQNSKGKSFQSMGAIGLDVCILYSINTCISDVVDNLGNTRTRYYFEELFGFGRGTNLGLPGDSSGTRNQDIFAQDINCPSCYARYGFGQGFFLSPVQLVRSFTAIANRGMMVEPYLVEKIEYSDGTEDFGTDPNSPIRREIPKQVIKESVARQVTGHMVGLIENTQPGVGANKARVAGYDIACKTGTAEKITNENGKVYTYQDNRKRGLYIHTMICFNTNTTNPIVFLVKIDEPKPGQVDNFSGDTIGPAISELMRSTLEYLNVPKNV
ncbi:MAG: penicillin-binding protein 2 [Patescibacteria group bacterium]